MLNIPEKFRKKLNTESNDSIISDIHKVIYNYEFILDNNTMEFFPEYTDHGIKHINSLLISCENIIPEYSINHLTGLDICVLIYSIILHDLGMHITSKQFEKLVETSDILLPEIDSICWKEAWHNYLNDIKKSDNKKKYDIFGLEDITVTEPNFSNLNDLDRRLIGEFIRINHPRIAHEIAVNPSLYFYSDVNNLVALSSDISDLTGFIARSHGMDLRSTFNYMQGKFGKGWKSPYNIKVIYLMAILRIADYIQIDNSRANNVILNTKRFFSNYSLTEWNLHNCIEFILENNEDPEQLHVHSTPKNVFLYLKLKKLLLGIQNEIDITWAILGETYGALNFKHLGLKYRRITSNIDDLKHFTEKVDYIPSEIKFKTDPAVLKLLIKPLYNNNPSLGVRELLQNAIDACFELKKIKLNFNQEYLPEIIISINKKNDGIYFTIEDNGVGMNENVIINYYFQAGVSFRNSREWISLFSDDNKNSQVQRSGKFGVGALAAFLLGDRINVFTHKYSEKYSYEFNAHITSDNIEIKKSISKIDGTCISIKMSDDVLEKITSACQTSDNKLDWFTWYKFEEPNISFKIDPEFSEAFKYLTSKELIPKKLDQISTWRSFMDENYDSVLWTYDLASNERKLKSDRKGELSSNGILIKNGFKIKSHQYFWAMPTVEIKDNNGYLPLSLDRNSIYNSQLPIEKKLLIDISKDLIAALLSINLDKSGELIHLHSNSSALNFKSKIPLMPHVIFNKNGYLLNNFIFFRELNIKNYWSIWLKEKSILKLADIGSLYYNVYRVGSINFNHDLISIHQNDMESTKFWFSPSNLIENGKHSGNCSILYKDPEINIYFKSQTKGNIDPFIKGLAEQASSKSLMESGKQVTLENQEIYNQIKSNSWVILSSKFGLPRGFYEFNIFNELIIKYLAPHFIIPFSHEEREKRFPLAFKELKDKIDWYRKYFNHF